MPLIIAMLFGIGQVMLTEQLFYAVNKKEFKKIIGFTLLKITFYGFGVILGITKGFWQLDKIIGGFIVAVPITALGLYIYRTIYNKNK